VDIDFKMTLEAHSDDENGFVEIILHRSTNSEPQDIRGQFQLIRSSDLDNYSTQEVIQDFVINDIVSSFSYSLYKDFTVQ